MGDEQIRALPDGTGSREPNPQAVSALRASIPNAEEIEQYLLRHPEQADYVVQMPGWQRIEPEELWIEGLGVWLRTDGSYASGDRARGGVIFSGADKARLARVSDYWKTSYHAQAIDAPEAPRQRTASESNEDHHND